MINRVVLILGDQLFADHAPLGIDDSSIIMMIEDESICRKFKYHKHKLIFVLSAMRHHFRKLLGTKRYYSLSDQKSIIEAVGEIIKELPITTLTTYIPANKPMRKQLERLAKQSEVELEMVHNPSFMVRKENFAEMIGKKPLMHQFYIKQRKQYKILLDDQGKPLGGSWSHDDQNRKKLPQNLIPPVPPSINRDQIVEDVITEVVQRFADHPGEGNTFWLPVTRKDAVLWLHKFFTERFEEFGPYEDAIHTDYPFLYHSMLSTLLNFGLLTPVEVINKAIEYHETHTVHLPSIEGFIRQIMGWREFVHGIYELASPKYITSNYFQHKKKMNERWYEGTTSIPPLDDMIRQLHEYGYAHHIQRLMVASNLMVLCEIDPIDGYNWFMELFVDSAEWVMTPNVIGMGLFADGGWFATKPYISSANYILKMSNYTKKSHGHEWIDTWQALYWRFVDRHREFFEQSPRMSFITRYLNKLTDDQIDEYYRIAEKFIESITQ